MPDLTGETDLKKLLTRYVEEQTPTTPPPLDDAEVDADVRWSHGSGLPPPVGRASAAEPRSRVRSRKGSKRTHSRTG